MQPIDVYLTYCAMKDFSTGDYDFSKYDGKSKVSRESFGKEMIEYFLLNCLENIVTQRLKNTYSQILSKTQKVGSVISTIVTMMSGNIKCKD